MARSFNWGHSFSLFEGRKVLVTGSSQGIGAAIATAFADCGADVAIHYNRNEDRANALVERFNAQGRKAFAIGGDLSKAGAGHSLVEHAAGALGGLDVMIHNAGGPLLREPFETLSGEDQERILQLNLNATFEILRASIPHVKRSENGVMILTTSVAVRNGGGQGVAVYGAAKAAMESMVRSLAIELAPDGVRVNGVAPGYIETNIHEGFSSHSDRENYVTKIPARRAGKAEDMVGAYLFFANERLSGYVTGQTLDVNGGMTLR